MAGTEEKNIVEKVLPWFTLNSVPGVGRYLFKRLLDHFESPECALDASVEDLLRVEGITRRLARKIINHRLPDRVKKDIELVKQNRIRITTMSDSDYPPLLLQLPDPPPFLYLQGNIDEHAKHIAVVGSRNATTYGLATARRLSADLASLGLTVVSGMALGIDTAAHEGALQVNGKTVAVLGSGFKRIYPAANHKLSRMIARKGSVITEFPMLTDPEPHNFPVRNRIISGMSLGTVVVEASRKSGSLITARLAAEQNREVFAVPGSIQSFKSTGTHTLIKQGAKLVENAQDIMDEIAGAFLGTAGVSEPGENHKKTRKNLPQLTDDETRIFKILSPYPVHIDNLARKTAMEPGRLSSMLLQLELKGIVRQSPGKLFSLVDD